MVDTRPQPAYHIPMDPLPTYQPVIGLDDGQIGTGWRRVAVDEVVKTYFQSYLLVPRGHWALTSFYTKQGVKVSGRSHYRAPASLSAWLSVAWPVLCKLVCRWTESKTPSP